jgi:hypothetical protein
MKFQYIIPILAVALFSVVAVNWMGAEEDTVADRAGEYARSTYQYAPDADTITDAEIDTLMPDFRFWSHWAYHYTIDVDNISGTTNIIAILQERSGDTTGDWFEVGRDTLSAAGTIRLPLTTDTDPQKGQVQGRRQRLIIDGAGTQSSEYTIIGNYRMW